MHATTRRPGDDRRHPVPRLLELTWMRKTSASSMPLFGRADPRPLDGPTFRSCRHLPARVLSGGRHESSAVFDAARDGLPMPQGVLQVGASNAINARFGTASRPACSSTAARALRAPVEHLHAAANFVAVTRCAPTSRQGIHLPPGQQRRPEQQHLETARHLEEFDYVKFESTTQLISNTRQRHRVPAQQRPRAVVGASTCCTWTRKAPN